MFTSHKKIISELKDDYNKQIDDSKRRFPSGEIDAFTYTSVVDRFSFLIYSLDKIPVGYLSFKPSESIYLDARV